MITQFATFLTIVAAITLVPGPDTVLVIRNTVRHGRAQGLRTAVGCAIGLAVWAFSASVGVALVLGIFARVANAIRVVGAVYLFATGMRLLWSGLRRARDGSAQVACPTPVAVETRAPMYAAIWQGLVTDLSNPKAAVFFTALLPQFIVGGTAANVFVSTAALGAVAVIAALLGLTAYAMVAARAGTRFGQRRFSTILDIAAGLALAGFGIDLLTRRITQSITPRARIAR